VLPLFRKTQPCLRRGESRCSPKRTTRRQSPKKGHRPKAAPGQRSPRKMAQDKQGHQENQLRERDRTNSNALGAGKCLFAAIIGKIPYNKRTNLLTRNRPGPKERESQGERREPAKK